MTLAAIAPSVKGSDSIVDLSENGKPGVVHQGGHDEDVYVKTAQGWRFKSRQMIRSISGVQTAKADAPTPR